MIAYKIVSENMQSYFVLPWEGEKITYTLNTTITAPKNQLGIFVFKKERHARAVLRMRAGMRIFKELSV